MFKNVSPPPPLLKGEGGIAGFINTIKARSDVKIFTLTYGNRSVIPAEIAHLFKNLSF
jgi:hypothetical protein